MSKETFNLQSLIRWMEASKGPRSRVKYYVDSRNGSDNYQGLTPDRAFATIGAAINVAVFGAMILIAEGGYDEAVSIPAGIYGLDIICEPGVTIQNSTPGTVISIAANNVRWSGGHIDQLGQVGFDITGDEFSGLDIWVYNCTDGFDLSGDGDVLINCKVNVHTVTAFDIQGPRCYLERCTANGTAATRGFYLSHTAAHQCVLFQCNTVNCSAGGYELVAGADNNLISYCNQSELCGGPTDAGANNSWVHHGEESQIAVGNTAAQDWADIHTLIYAVNLRARYSMDFWSVPATSISVTSGAGDIALPDIIVDSLPAGCTVVRAVLMFKFRMIEDSSGAGNALDGAQEIQVRTDTPGAWADGINLIADQFTLAVDARENGDVCIGAIDLSGTVTGNDTYNVQWAQALSDADSLDFYDIQVGLRIWYSV